MRASLLRPAVVGVFAGVLLSLPAPAADEPTKEELATSQNNLKEIGIAFHGYAAHHDEKWAEDLTDKDGKVLLSWRVSLLPYVEALDLYKRFKLNEPWDSEHNKKLIAEMPKIYAPVRGKAKPGETYYQRFVGKGALFNERGSDYTIPAIPDGTSNTALVVEAGDPVIWTKPQDLPFNKKAPLPKLGGLFGGDFNALFCDGSVYRIRKDYDADTMKLVIMPADGTLVDLKKLQK
jgi:prepilin-type processing-associated H-X9-DG protein